MNRVEYGKQQLIEVFKEFGTKVDVPVTVYLFGGGAMAFRGQKSVTKDLDLAFLDQKSYSEFVKAVGKSGFHKQIHLEKPYKEMEASSIWQKEDGFRLDLFVNKICNKLEVSKSMVLRSETFQTFGNLTVNMLANEDLVLLKGITQRERDVDDIADIIRSTSIDWSALLQECVSQSTVDYWYGSLHDKLSRIKEKHQIDSPILDELNQRYERTFLLEYYKMKREEGKTHEQILDLLRSKEYGFTEKELEQLENDLKER